MNSTKRISPWAWVPTLYFAQGIPYFIVNKLVVPTLDYQALLESVHRHHQDKTMVDCFHANPNVDSIHSVDTVHSKTG